MATRSASVSSDQSEQLNASAEKTGNDPPPYTLTDVVHMLANLNTKFDTMNSCLDTLSGAVTDLSGQVTGLAGRVADLQNKNDQLTEQNRELNAKVGSLEEKVGHLEERLDDVEGRSRRSNLLFYGIPQTSKNETWQESEETVKSVLKEKLGIEDNIQFDRVHRLKGGAGSSSSPPIIAKFAFYKDKEHVLRNKQKLKGSDIFVGEDFTKRVRDIRKKLSSHLKSAKAAQRSATMVYDHLIIEGKRYNYDPANDDIVLAT
nr:hypothetical protein BaRGS_006489 [Batillaria attramentaria]KAG5696034.1 hypothetical protein BaRGS_017146 [Batillaria attramentaria]KAG5713691.1 hypothetical protein BaRGS_024739 [Batillaria attramentaria]